MALTNIDKFIESLMWMWNSPETAALFGDLKLALDKQGLAYKDGKIIKSQRRVSAEAKETGYGESEDEKKELKKIEEEPQLKEGKYYECIKSYYYLGGGQYWFEEGKVYFCEKDGYLRSDPNNNIYVYDCKNWQSCFRPYTEKPDWSKEDRDYYDAIIAKLEVTQDDAALTDNQMEFLKSLKDRIVPQSQQDWSEEDEMESERVIGLLEGWLSTFIRYAEDCKHGIAWLKSIKNRIGG